MDKALFNDEQEKPLQHLQITDLTIMLPGPYLTRLLAQYGADVVKVEALPEGDMLRHIPDTSAFQFLNQGKRSLGVNLKTDEGVGIVKRLANEADVFVENFREGVMDSMGIGYAELSEENPDLIYLSLRGVSGKQARKAAHDLNFISASGCGEWFLESGAPNYSSHFADLVGGMMVPALKLLMHLSNPERRGMHIVSYMDEGFRTLYAVRAYEQCQAEKKPGAKDYGIHGILGGKLPHSRYYRCRDGHWVSLNALQKKHWDVFCEAVDRPAWKERLSDVTLVPDLEKLFLESPSNYWEGIASNRDMCLQRVIPWSEHLTFTDARTQLEQDPFTWAGFQSNPRLAPAPELGRDTFAILHSLGFSNKEIGDWLKNHIALQSEKK